MAGSRFQVEKKNTRRWSNRKKKQKRKTANGMDSSSKSKKIELIRILIWESLTGDKFMTKPWTSNLLELCGDGSFTNIG